MIYDRDNPIWRVLTDEYIYSIVNILIDIFGSKDNEKDKNESNTEQTEEVRI